MQRIASDGLPVAIGVFAAVAPAAAGNPVNGENRSQNARADVPWRKAKGKSVRPRQDLRGDPG